MIDKIVVCGCSFSLPGQSGVDQIWSHHLEKSTGLPVINITNELAKNNSGILRNVYEYVCSNKIKQTLFIIQWTNIDRLEYCDNDDTWYQASQNPPNDVVNRADIQMKIDKIKEVQAYTHSQSTYFWQWIQQVLCLDAIMQKFEAKYFQTYCFGTTIKNFYNKSGKNYFHKHHTKVLESLAKTNWLLDNMINADLQDKKFETVSEQDTHFSPEAHKQVAQLFELYIRRKKWL